MTKNVTRRALVIRDLIAGSNIPISETILVGRAESPSLDPNDPTARALSYITQSTNDWAIT